MQRLTKFKMRPAVARRIAVGHSGHPARYRLSANLRQCRRLCAADRVFPGEEEIHAVARTLKSLYKFSRPHTVVGTALSVCSVSLAAVQGAPSPSWGPLQTRALVVAMSAALLANISIVGTNQCFDIAIDRVNKPYLPLASGEWPLQTGIAVSAITGILACAIAIGSGSVPLMATVLGSIGLGLAYSVDLPFLRWKNYPLVAASCILAVRAVLVQVGFWRHMEVTGLNAMPGGPDTSMLFLAAFMVLFSVVIALFKDIPDVRGDQLHGTQTASVRFGTHRVFWVCISLLVLDYVLAMGYIIMACKGFLRMWTVLCQGSLAMALLYRVKQTNLHKHADVVETYMFIWKLFYAQYLLFPLVACGELSL
eukprot:jgi/Ulvmu1/12500/UM009_0154.1